MRGMGRIFQRGTIWWIAYYVNGKEHRESARSEREADAKRLLKGRIKQILGGRYLGPQEERVKFEDLVAGYLQDYEVRGLRSTRSSAMIRVSHLREQFSDMRALDISTGSIRQYQVQRRREGASAATVNRETSALGRMFRIAVKLGQLTTVPVFPDRLEESPPKQGFFEHSEYLAVRHHLPDGVYQDVLDFAYYSGWRRGEITGLTWDEIELERSVITLPPERSKTKTGRTLPLSSPLRAVVERRLSIRRLGQPLVFHKNGAPIGDWRKTWTLACRRAGLPEKLLHDCRRTAARNMVRAGVPENVAMRLTGHKTRNVFDRYNIVSERDLKQGVDQLATYVEAQSLTGIRDGATAAEKADSSRTVGVSKVTKLLVNH